MASGWLDSLLNVVIPLAIFLFFGLKIYEGMQEPIDSLLGWIRSQFEDPEGGLQDPDADREIVFR